MINAFLGQLFLFAKFCVYLFALLVFVCIVIAYTRDAVCSCIKAYFDSQNDFLDRLGKEVDDSSGGPTSPQQPISSVRH